MGGAKPLRGWEGTEPTLGGLKGFRPPSPEKFKFFFLASDIFGAQQLQIFDLQGWDHTYGDKYWRLDIQFLLLVCRDLVIRSSSAESARDLLSLCILQALLTVAGGCRCLKKGYFSAAELYPELWQTCHRWHGFMLAICKGHRCLRAFPSFYLISSIWPLISCMEMRCPGIRWWLLKRLLRAFTKMSNSRLRGIAEGIVRLEGRSLCNSAFTSCSIKTDGFLSLSVWKSGRVAWTFNCKNLAKPCYWNSRWTTT